VRTQARFPDVGAKSGHYESFYLKACRPGGGLGIWIRHTVHKRPRARPTAALWFVLFDAEADSVTATKASFPDTELANDANTYIKVDGAMLVPGRATGEVHTEALDASWDLTFTDEGEPMRHLPYRWMYAAPLPRTKFLSPYAAALFSGPLKVGDREIELQGWPGMIGHNWGGEHAERWTWIHGADFAGHPDARFDLAAGRIKIGPWTTPWVGNGFLVLDGERHRLGGLDRVRSTKIDDSPTRCVFEMAGDDVTVRGRVKAQPKDVVGWVYADPDGGEHNTLNCSIADLELTVELEGGEPRQLRVSGGAAYEIGMRETDHGLPIQPYADG
jgi:hypothetical protein